MLSRDTFLTLSLAITLLVAMIFDKPDRWWEALATMALCFPFARALFWFVAAFVCKDSRDARNSVLGSACARSLGVTLRMAFPAFVVELPILDVGVARVRFFSTPAVTWLRLRFKSPALDRAPWLHLNGDSSFWLPALLLGARALPLRKPVRHWRYWRLPWMPPDPTVESPEFCAALPPTKNPLVLMSRPGRLVIRADCSTDASVEFENAVNLAIAWVKAVQQTAGVSHARQ